MPRLRIEVLKRVLHEELIREKLPEEVVPHVTICPEVEEGQVFIAASLDQIPEGFCSAAWTDIANKVAPQLAENPNNTGTFYLSCMDSLRPVTFGVSPLAK